MIVSPVVRLEGLVRLSSVLHNVSSPGPEMTDLRYHVAMSSDARPMRVDCHSSKYPGVYILKSTLSSDRG